MTKKRANGEGSIRKKPSGRWEGRYTQGIDPVTGRAIQKSVSAKTQAECKEKLEKAIRENRGVPLNHTGDYTAAEWCRLWFETYSKPNIRYNTAKGYEGIIEHHIIPAIGAIKLKQLSSIHIQRMYNDLKENGRMQRGSKQNDKALSNTFVRRVHAVLQAALKQAVKERLIPYNPCENCRIPPKDKKEMTILPPEKIGRYLQEAEKYGVLPMFYLELSSGLRRGELLALQWEDLNVKERILTVNKQVTRMEGELDAPCAVLLHWSNRAEKVKMGIGCAAVLTLLFVKGHINGHAPADKLPKQKFPCQSDVFFKRKFILQGNFKTVCKLGVLTTLGFFNCVP